MEKVANHYYMGFICKCAEYGLEGEIVEKMYKQALFGTIAAGIGTAMYGNRNDYMARNMNDYSTKLMNDRNANLARYRDQVDSGKAGTGLGRFWHGMMDNAVGRAMGIRGSADYLTDKEVERAEGANALAQKDIERQNRINAAYAKGPQLDNLQLSTQRGYTQQTSANPRQPTPVNTRWGAPAAPRQPAQQPAQQPQQPAPQPAPQQPQYQSIR